MQRRVVTKRIVSPDGKVIAEVTSEVVADQVSQSVEVSADGTYTRVRSCGQSGGSVRVTSRVFSTDT
jgi:hypothetical protein